MESEICAVPEKCINCGSFFDLGYDLAGNGEEMSMEELLVATSSLSRNSLLCWGCR